MPPTSKSQPALPQRWSSGDVNAAIERVTPDVLALLQDGVPRTRKAIMAALAERHGRDDVRRALMRLAVLGRLVERNGRYGLGPGEPEGGQA